MLKLISLEIKKFRLYNYWLGILIANIAIVALIIMFFVLERSDANIPFEDFDVAMLISNSLIRGTFLIFASVIIVKIIIDEYKNGSINIMFTYPISRKKIMAAKLLIIVIFTFINIMITSLIVEGGMYAADRLFDIIPGEIGREAVLDNIMKSFLGAAASAGLSLIPLYFGLRKKSAAATIITALILVSLVNSTNENFSVFSIIAIPLSLGFIGLLIGYASIRKVEYKDI